MSRMLSIAALWLLSSLSQASPSPQLYQIDLIVFTHPSSASQQTEPARMPLLPPNAQRAIPLQNTAADTRSPYHLRPNSTSQLNQEYWALTHKTDYQVLAHYTWLQPSNNQRPIAIPAIHRNGWNIEGTLRVRQSNYYLLDTELLFSTANTRQSGFLFSQKQRLKPGTVYYLDHPQAGMLIKVHLIADRVHA